MPSRSLIAINDEDMNYKVMLKINSTAILDQNKINEIKMLDVGYGELFPKLVTIFHQEYSTRLPEVRSLLNEPNLENFRKVDFILHRFKSTLLNVGASRGYEIAVSIENEFSGRKGEHFQLKPFVFQLIDILENECHSALQLLLLEVKAA